jgi:hypothetical protein
MQQLSSDRRSRAGIDPGKYPANWRPPTQRSDLSHHCHYKRPILLRCTVVPLTVWALLPTMKNAGRAVIAFRRTARSERVLRQAIGNSEAESPG